MSGRLILSVGMPRAGSGWYYNLTHDLLVATGHQDAHQVRQRYHLQALLTEVNCNLGALTPHRLLLVMLPVWMGNTFVVKTHAAPRSLARWMMRRGWIQPTYIYRDPRDALLSAYEYGQRSRQRDRGNAFARLESFEKAVVFMQEYVRISQAWLSCPQALHTRYEDLLIHYEEQSARLVEFLGLSKDDPEVIVVVDRYCPETARTDQKGIHFVKGKIGRFRQVLTAEQQEACQRIFKDYLERAGYPL